MLPSSSKSWFVNWWIVESPDWSRLPEITPDQLGKNACEAGVCVPPSAETMGDNDINMSVKTSKIAPELER
jgi:hypothetical protein